MEETDLLLFEIGSDVALVLPTKKHGGFFMIEHSFTKSQVEYAKVVCWTCQPVLGKIIGSVHHGAGQDAEPISVDDLVELEEMASEHNELWPEHDIKCQYFSQGYA